MGRSNLGHENVVQKKGLCRVIYNEEVLQGIRVCEEPRCCYA